MKVTLRTLMAGPAGVVHPGQTVDLPDEQATELVEEGYAEFAVEVDDGETTTAQIAGETTVKPFAGETRAKRPKKK